jgi:hypothetical protein
MSPICTKNHCIHSHFALLREGWGEREKERERGEERKEGIMEGCRRQNI